MCRNLIIIVFVVTTLSGCKTMTHVIQHHSKEYSVDQDKVWIPAKTNKIWVNPYIDENGHMIDGHYKYIVVKQGYWAVKEVVQPEQSIELNQG